jgi:tripartite-type tricarboxylate transporter receptor subunit TctC
MGTCIRLVAALAGILGLLPAAAAQTYPSRPVRIIVAYPAGGATDVITRAVTHKLGELWGQQIVIENRGGAGTQIAAEAVAKAAPDGYTLLATAEATFVVNPSLYAKLSYDAVRDFIPVTGLGLINQVLVAHPAVPVQSVADVIAQAKAKPGAVNYATIGLGSSGHLNMELFQAMAGVKMTPVHYRGGAPALTDLIGGHVPMSFLSIAVVAQALKAGQLRGVAVGSAKRLAEFPDLPTVAEAGLPGYEAVTWFGLFAPAGTPRDAVARVNADVQRVLADPAFRQSFLGPNYFEPITGTPEQFADSIRVEAARWSKVIRDAKLTAE